MWQLWSFVGRKGQLLFCCLGMVDIVAGPLFFRGILGRMVGIARHQGRFARNLKEFDGYSLRGDVINVINVINGN